MRFGYFYKQLTNKIRKDKNMLETATINTLNIEDFMSSFGITRLETQKDEGLLSKGSCKQRILDLITMNIKISEIILGIKAIK